MELSCVKSITLVARMKMKVLQTLKKLCGFGWLISITEYCESLIAHLYGQRTKYAFRVLFGHHGSAKRPIEYVDNHM